MSNRDWCFKCYHARECMCEKAKHPQTDLLEKLDMMREAVERNPARWWEELEVVQNGWAYDVTDAALWDCVKFGDEIRLKPQRKWAEGWVDAEVIQRAEQALKFADHGTNHLLAKALLELVKDSND